MHDPLTTLTDCGHLIKSTLTMKHLLFLFIVVANSLPTFSTIIAYGQEDAGLTENQTRSAVTTQAMRDQIGFQ